MLLIELNMYWIQNISLTASSSFLSLKMSSIGISLYQESLMFMQYIRFQSLLTDSPSNTSFISVQQHPPNAWNKTQTLFCSVLNPKAIVQSKHSLVAHDRSYGAVLDRIVWVTPLWPSDFGLWVNYIWYHQPMWLWKCWTLLTRAVTLLYALSQP